MDRPDSLASSISIAPPAPASFWHPTRLPYLLVVLFFICFLSFGNYFVYDNPSALQKHILSDMNVKFQDFTLLYSVYSWPNVVLSVLGGFLIDCVLGIRVGSIIFCLFIMAGQVVFALGGIFDSFTLMIVGRFIFGLGGENLAVCQNLYSALWFKDRMLNMVFGLQLSIARLGSSTNLWVMEPLYQSLAASFGKPGGGSTILGIALMIGGVFCLFSLFCAVVLLFLDRHGKSVLKRDERTGKPSWKDLKEISEVRHFPLEMWLICLICVFYYIAVFPFVGIGQTFYIMKYDVSPSTANTITSLVYFISLFASPVLGFLIDRIGKNIFWILCGVILTTVAHMLLAFSFITPLFCTGLLGFAYSVLASSLWPLVAYSLPAKQLGTGYGIMQAVQNLGLAIMPLVAGVVVDNLGYLVQEIIFLLCLFAALSCAMLLWIVDNRHTGKLNMSTKQRKLLEASEEKKD